LRKSQPPFVIILMTASVPSAFGVSRKLLDVKLYDYDWDADMNALDLLSNELRNEADSISDIPIYGAKRSRSGEIERKTKFMEE
jgi:hypothetical protein